MLAIRSNERYILNEFIRRKKYHKHGRTSFNLTPSKSTLRRPFQIESLDLSCKNLKDLSFLYEFKNLCDLVLDDNRELNLSSLPILPSLKLLWLNNCFIDCETTYVMIISEKCPNLKYLSLMNKFDPQTDEELTMCKFKYSNSLATLFPNLLFFNDQRVTK